MLITDLRQIFQFQRVWNTRCLRFRFFQIGKNGKRQDLEKCFISKWALKSSTTFKDNLSIVYETIFLTTQFSELSLVITLVVNTLIMCLTSFKDLIPLHRKTLIRLILLQRIYSKKNLNVGFWTGTSIIHYYQQFLAGKFEKPDLSAAKTVKKWASL